MDCWTTLHLADDYDDAQKVDPDEVAGVGIDAGDEKNMTADELDLAGGRTQHKRVPFCSVARLTSEVYLTKVYTRGVCSHSVYTCGVYSQSVCTRGVYSRVIGGRVSV